MTIRELLEQYSARFRSAGLDSPQVEADYLVSEVTGLRHYELMLNPNRILTDREMECASSYLERRLRHEPYQYIYGWAAFRHLDLKVGPGVLIPRPETEVLVDYVLKHLKPASTVCELGVGSGAISLSIAYERPDCQVYGVESEPDALRWAEQNRVALGLNQVSFMQGDLFDPFHGKKFDAIVGNLPYIPLDALPDLPANVSQYEPHSALFAPEAGFALIRRAIQQAPSYLKYCGGLFLEMGEEQGPAAVEAATATRAFQRISMENDQYGIPRFLVALVS